MKIIKFKLFAGVLCSTLTISMLFNIGNFAEAQIFLPRVDLPLVISPLVPKLWGWADLHAHPASHLAFGADASGDNGIFWGKPGLSLEYDSLLSDLQPCAPDKHGGFDADIVRHLTHIQIVQAIDKQTGHTHMPSGSDRFISWPNARSLSHQQMHVTSIRRAFDGGQRLMIASATDNQLLSQADFYSLTRELANISEKSTQKRIEEKQNQFLKQSLFK
jgi:hypothetical protein